MITLYDKSTKQPVSVYKIRKDKCGFAECLVWYHDAWMWRSMKHYVPYEETINYSYVVE